MKIDEMFQDLHAPRGSSTDWVAIQRVERDICLCYHQLADYAYIMGDLYYGDVYSAAYWTYLDVQGLDDEDRRVFLRDGCLILILAMCWEEIDGSGSTIHPKITECREAISRLRPEDDVGRRLRALVLAALDAAVSGAEPEGLMAESTWAHDAIVKEYFRRRARDFDALPYFTGTKQP